MTMLEKMARAICAENSRAIGLEVGDNWQEADEGWKDWLGEARAALEAIREPGDCIEEAMRHDDWFPSMWRDCVDAILSQK